MPKQSGMHMVILRLTAASVHEQLGVQAHTFGKIVLLFTNSAIGDEHSHGHLLCINTNVATFPRTMEGINFKEPLYLVVCYWFLIPVCQKIITASNEVT